MEGEMRFGPWLVLCSRYVEMIKVISEVGK